MTWFLITQYVQVEVECDVVPDYTICAGRGKVFYLLITQYVQVEVECDVVPDYTICAGRGRV